MDVGITCLSDFILSEGPVVAVESLSARARATAVSLNPTVTEPAADGEGSFQPPADGGSSPRLFDRPLWGKHRLWVRSEPSYEPDIRLYERSAYPPRPAGALTQELGPSVRRFIRLGHERGLEVSFQIGAAAPPGLRDEDRPRLPGGGLASHPMAGTASLASPAVRSYYRAYLTDLVRAYPEIDTIRVDWPEYPCYTLDEAFADFHPAANMDPALEREIAEVYRFLRAGLTNPILCDWIEAARAGAPFVHLFGRIPALAEWLARKREIAIGYLRFLRNVMDDAGAAGITLAPNAFPPPFSLLTGLPFADIHEVAPWVGVKLYTMHWLQIVRFWTDDILAWLPALDESLVAEALLLLFDVGDDLPRPLDPADVRYPEPDEPHPVGDASQRRKIAQARLECRARVEPIVHGYGTLEDFARRFRAAGASAGAEPAARVAAAPSAPAASGGPAPAVAARAAPRLWINRYGYLSDEKLDVIGARGRSAS